MPRRIQLRRPLLCALALAPLGLTWIGVRIFLDFRPAAITLGANTTIYFSPSPSLVTRVHEAIHRRQMAEKSLGGRFLNAIRYNLDYGYRLDEEAEAKAGEICLQIHRFSPDLPAYTTARSRSQAETYRAWAWERARGSVPDRVGEQLQYGERCHEILADVTLDLPPGEQLSEDETLKLAAFHFLQAYGSSDSDVATWKARLELTGWAQPVRWARGAEVPPFWLNEVARPLASPSDSSIDAAQAGDALHRLTYYQARRMYAQLLPPLPGYRHRELVPSDLEDRLGMSLAVWPSHLVQTALRGPLDEEAVEKLQELAAHPLNRDFDVFAHAREADVIGTRYHLPVAGGWGRLVPTELGPVREAFQVQWGRAALRVQEGDLAGAEHVLRTVIGASLQMERSAPFEEDGVEALYFLDRALRSLALVVEAQDGAPPAWAALLDEPAPEKWTKGYRAAVFSEDPAAIYRSLPLIVRDADIPQAFKRFAYQQVALYDVCLTLRGNRASRADSRTWRRAVESGLVRHESDRALLDMMRGDVEGLMVASDVEPDAICEPTGVVRPLARSAIMSSPLKSQLPPMRSGTTRIPAEMGSRQQ